MSLTRLPHQTIPVYQLSVSSFFCGWLSSVFWGLWLFLTTVEVTGLRLLSRFARSLNDFLLCFCGWPEEFPLISDETCKSKYHTLPRA